jgi:hypothetical protein
MLRIAVRLRFRRVHLLLPTQGPVDYLGLGLEVQTFTERGLFNNRIYFPRESSSIIYDPLRFLGPIDTKAKHNSNFIRRLRSYVYAILSSCQ